MKCMKCNCTFEPTEAEYKILFEQIRTNGRNYIPFCSEECASYFYPAKVLKKKPNGFLIFHTGEKGEPPKFGTWEKRKVKRGSHVVEVDVNVGGKIETRPMTEDEHVSTIRNRGRSQFSEGCKVCVLPSASLYKGKFDYSKYRNS